MKPFLICATAIVLLGGVAPKAVGQEAKAVGKDSAPIFVPFDFYARHHKALGFSEEQRRALKQITDSLQKEARRLEEERGKRTQALQAAIAQNPVDVERAMAAFGAVLEAENELKALQFRGGLTMRNVLTPEQFSQVQALAVKDGADRIGGARAALSRRLQDLRDEVRQRTGGQPPREIIERIQLIEQATQEGRFSEAKSQLESVLRKLRGEPEPGSPTDVSQKPAEPPR